MGVFYELTFTTTTGSERIAFQDVGDAQDVLDLIQQLQLGVARVQEKYIVPDLNVFCEVYPNHPLTSKIAKLINHPSQTEEVFMMRVCKPNEEQSNREEE
jgi:hypothetical protein